MHQYLTFIGDFPIRMYGLMLCLAIFMATATAYFLARQDGRWHRYVLDLGIYGGFAGLIGARLWDVFFFDWSYYQDHLLEIPFVWQGGMAVQGGMLAGLAAGIWYCKRHRIDWIALADITCPAMILGQAIGRMANLLNGDAFGAPTGGNFGILYPEGTLARATYGSQPLWPAEVWEGQIDVVIFPPAPLPLLPPHERPDALPVRLPVLPGTLLPGISARRLRGTVALRPDERPVHEPLLHDCLRRLLPLRRLVRPAPSRSHHAARCRRHRLRGRHGNGPCRIPNRCPVRPGRKKAPQKTQLNEQPPKTGCLLKEARFPGGLFYAAAAVTAACPALHRGCRCGIPADPPPRIGSPVP